MNFDSWNTPNQPLTSQQPQSQQSTQPPQFNQPSQIQFPSTVPTFSQPSYPQNNNPSLNQFNVPQFKPPTSFNQPQSSITPSLLPHTIKPFQPLPSSQPTQSYTPAKTTQTLPISSTFSPQPNLPNQSNIPIQSQTLSIKPFQPLPQTYNTTFSLNTQSTNNLSTSSIPQFKAPSTFSPATFTPAKPTFSQPIPPPSQPLPFVPLVQSQPPLQQPHIQQQPHTLHQPRQQSPFNIAPATFQSTPPLPAQPPAQLPLASHQPQLPLQLNTSPQIHDQPAQQSAIPLPPTTQQHRFSNFGTGNVDDEDSDGLKTPPPESAALLAQHDAQSLQSNSNLPPSTCPTPTPSNPFPQYAHEDDIPLLEELGIDLSLIFIKTKQIVKLPFSSQLRHQLSTTLSHTTNTEYDLTGPLVFCLILGCLLMVLQGKIHFGYIYGFTLVGCIGLWFLCNVLCDYGINIDIVFHVIGYSLAPLLLLPPLRFIGFNVLHTWTSILQLISLLAIISSTILATLYFECVIHLQSQRYIIAYPIAMFYFCFVLLIMF